MSDACLFGSSLASVMINCLIMSLCCDAAYCTECKLATAHAFEIDALEKPITHGPGFLYFVVSVNSIGPGFQRKVRGTPLYPSFMSSASAVTEIAPQQTAASAAADRLTILIIASLSWPPRLVDLTVIDQRHKSCRERVVSLPATDAL